MAKSTEEKFQDNVALTTLQGRRDRGESMTASERRMLEALEKGEQPKPRSKRAHGKTPEERLANALEKKEANRERARAERAEEHRRRRERAEQHAASQLEGTDELPEGGDDLEAANRSIPPALARMRKPIFAMRANDPVTDHEKALFLETYAKTGQLYHAAHVTGRAYETFKRMRNEDVVFDETVRMAGEMFNESLSTEIVRRARDGILVPVFSQQMGCVIGYQREYSDRLLEVEAKRRMPDQYRENMSLDVNSTQTHVLVVQPPAETIEDWKARRDVYLERRQAERQKLLPSPDKGKPS